jgi:hypothetical protein
MKERLRLECLLALKLNQSVPIALEHLTSKRLELKHFWKERLLVHLAPLMSLAMLAQLDLQRLQLALRQ